MRTEDHTAAGKRSWASLPRDYTRNLFWMLGGRVFRLGLSVTVGAWVARHLAPAEFGELSYMLSMVALLSALAGAGLDGLIVRELIDQRRDRGETLCTAFALRVGAGLVLYLGLLLSWWALKGDGIGFRMVALLGADIVLQGANVFDLDFQARRANKWTVIAGTISLVVASAVRIALILGGAQVVHFAAAVMLEAALQAGLLAALYLLRRSSLERWHFSFGCARTLLAESWPMIISAAAVAGCMRVDQLMLKALAGEAAVGVYAAASRLGEAWYFLPMFIGTVLNPWILEARSMGELVYRRRLTQFYGIMIWSSFAVAVALSLVASPLIELLYGAEYVDAAAPLRIHVIGGVFLALGVATGKWYVAEGHTIGAMRKALLGLSVNLAGNAVLIPRYGLCGAAAATAAGHLTANVLYDLLDARVRPQLALKLRALAPWSLQQP